MKQHLKSLRDKVFGINLIKDHIDEMVRARDHHADKETPATFGIPSLYDDLPHSLREVESLYQPIEGSFKDNNGNPTFTNMELESARLIAQLVMLHRPSSVLETGTHEGYSAAHMAFAMEVMKINGHIHTFDPFKVAHRFENNTLQKYVTWINDYTTNYTKHRLPGSFDFMLLDSDHTYRTLAYEVNVFEPMLETGGLLVMHDTIVFKDLWPVVDALKKSARFDMITFDTPRNWAGAALNGSGLTVCRKLCAGDPIAINEAFYKKENIDAYIRQLPKEKVEHSKKSMFFSNAKI